MINDSIYINGISPIDVNSMSVQKYGEHDRPTADHGGRKEESRKKYRTVQEKIAENTKQEKIIRKDRSLQEHMQFMIWIGQKNKTILQD